MLLLDTRPISSPPDRQRDPYDDLQEPDRPDTYRSSRAEEELLALTLITTWTARTGRTLRDVPVEELTAYELEEFWADDQLEPPYTTRRRRAW